MIRTATPDDVAGVQLALYLAITWDKPEAPPLEQAVQHPELRKFWVDWGRTGDIAVIAEDGAELIGGAFGRTFTEEEHFHGFVDEATPEIGIGIVSEARGRGLGRRLMLALEGVAMENGIDALSLSVNIPNPARSLYSSLGYRELDRDEDSVRMIKKLTGFNG